MGTCGCHWARGRREAPAAKVAAGGRMPQDRTRIRTAALFARRSTDCHGFAPSATERQLPQTYAIMGWDRRPQYEVRLRYPAPLAFRAQGLAKAESWQDLRAVHDSRSLCSEKGPFLARYSRGVSSNGDLQDFSDTWRADLAKASSF